MSINSLLATEPPCMLCRRVKPGETDAAGVALDTDVTEIRYIQGRLTILDGRQQEAWHAINVQATYEFTSTDGGARSGMLLRSADQRLFRINGDHSQEYPKGNIRPSTFVYPLLEVTMAGGGESGG